MSKKVLSSFILLSSIAFFSNSYAMEQSPRGIQPQPGIYYNIELKEREFFNGIDRNFICNILNYLLCQPNYQQTGAETLVNIFKSKGIIMNICGLATMYRNGLSVMYRSGLADICRKNLATMYSNNIKELYSKFIGDAVYDYDSGLKLGGLLEKIKIDFEKFEKILETYTGVNKYTKHILSELFEDISDEVFAEFREELLFDLGYEDDIEVIRKRLEENGLRLVDSSEESEKSEEID